MQQIKIATFPMPPSQNQAYRNLNVPGLRGRAKTMEYKSFENEVTHYAIRNRETILEARELCAKVAPGVVLEVRYLFRFKSILMKEDGIKNPKKGERKLKGSPKQNDTSNRLKVLEDVLAALLGIDDCWFWSGSYDKVEEKNKLFPECVDIWIRLRENDAQGYKLMENEEGEIVVERVCIQ